VGGTRQRHFDGTNFKPRKLPENAQTPTTMAPAYFAGDRVHAVLGGFVFKFLHFTFYVHGYTKDQRYDVNFGNKILSRILVVLLAIQSAYANLSSDIERYPNSN
jgi:hypothetical protein